MGGRHVFAAHPVLVSLLACCPLAFILSWPSAIEVWHTGAFANTDDATRMVQIRDWMAGQDWFDLTVHRLGLPQGLLSHWSRVVDVPIAGLIRGFGLMLPPNLAERAARIAYPLALQIGLIGAMAYAARVLAGPRAALAAGLLIVFSGIGFFQFEPGRVHHHSPQILLLTLAVATVLDGLDPANARRAVWSGLSIALSLAIGLENLPFIAVLLIVPTAAWILVGSPLRSMLLWFSASLAITTSILYVATVPPWRYAVSSVDAMSLVHLVVTLLVAGLGTGLALVTARLPTMPIRFASAAVAGGFGAGLLWLCFPEAWHGPFYGMDPLLRPFWLDEVEEVRPLLRMLREQPDTIVILMMPMLAGTLGATLALLRTRGLARLRWAAVMPLLLVGFAGTVWGIRVASSLQPLALLGAAWAVGWAWDWAKRDGRGAAIILPGAAFAVSSSLVWAMVPFASASTPADAAPSCANPDALAPLAKSCARSRLRADRRRPLSARPYGSVGSRRALPSRQCGQSCRDRGVPRAGRCRPGHRPGERCPLSHDLWSRHRPREPRRAGWAGVESGRRPSAGLADAASARPDPVQGLQGRLNLRTDAASGACRSGGDP